MNYIDSLALQIRALVDDKGDYDGVTALYRLYALLALVKGAATTAKDVHDAWAVWAAQYKPGHRCLVPFNDLASDIQQLDEPFVRAIQQAANGA